MAYVSARVFLVLYLKHDQQNCTCNKAACKQQKEFFAFFLKHFSKVFTFLIATCRHRPLAFKKADFKIATFRLLIKHRENPAIGTKCLTHFKPIQLSFVEI